MENKNITLEQIDLLMNRAQVSYTDAKEALEATDGDILEALLWLEKNKKVNTAPTNADFSAKVGGFIDKLNKTRFKMFKHHTTYVNIPLSIALLLIIPTFYVSIIALLISLIIGVKIELEGDTDIAEKVNAEIDKFQK
ncbi:MAG: DUF4342 domain-containing protein [Cellulosilyticaceae bacterium]